MDDKLLEKIAELLHMTCLSDLHVVSASDLISAIGQVEKTDYPLENWDYALTYICKCEVKLGAVTEIDQTLAQLK